MSEQLIREQICEIGKRIYKRGMVAANDGNISVRIGENEILCTPTGVSKGYMTPESICKVDEKGQLIEANGNYRPSSEMKMHIRVYEKRPDVGAVVHAHPMYATSFAIARKPLDRPITSEAVVLLGAVPVADYGTPSTEELPDNIEKFLPYYDAMLLANHGALTYSDDLEAAYLRMESLEFYAELMYRTQMIGGAVEFNTEEMQKLYEVRNKTYKTGRHPAAFDVEMAKKNDIDIEEIRKMPGYQYDFLYK